MKLTLKTLQQSTFNVDVEPTEKISQLKEKIEKSQGFAVPTQKLIFSGKILADDKTVGEYNITEKDFVVVMVAKPKATTSAPAPQPAAQPTPTPAPAPTPATPAPVTAPATQAQPAAAPTGAFDASTLATGDAFNSAVANLVEMGFPREEVLRAMRAAYNNPDRAAEYLMTGIPDTALEAPAPTSATTAAAPTPATNQPFNMFAAPSPAGQQPQAAAGAVPAAAAPGGGAPGDLSFLRNSPQFQQLRQLVATQPELLQPLLQQIGASNPQLMQMISQNQDQFLSLLAGDGSGEGMEGEEAGGEQQQYITISPEEDAAIQRLTALGFDRGLAIEAFFACDKNEELAANYLFDMQGGDFQ